MGVTRRATAWLLLAVALMLMTLRRAYAAYLRLGESLNDLVASWPEELLEIGASALLLAAVIAIMPTFRALRRTQERLGDKNRALAMLSECNERMIRASSEGELVAEVCRLIVGVGGYRFAWIGEVRDAPRVIAPIARAGHEAGYLDRLELTWDDTERGRGPAGTAVRTRAPAIVHDVTADPTFAPWRDEAARQGYGAVAAWPLVAGDRVFGVLAVYAGRAFAFHREELTLLGELAEDLAYGMTSLRGQAARERAEANYRELFQHAPYGVFRTGPDGRLTLVNDALVSMLGYADKSELLGLDLATAVYPDPADRRSLVERYADRDRIAEDPVRWQRRDGAPILVRLSGRVLRTSGRTVEGVEVAVEDVTTLRELEQQYRQAQKLEAVGRLATGVAHDFNNLLTVMLAASEALVSRLGPGAPGHEDAEDMRQAARRGAALTSQLLAFGRRQMLAVQPVDLNALIGGMEGMLRRLLGEDVELAVRIAARLPPVIADPGRLEQVVVNLAVNARDAMPRGGVLTIQTQAAAFATSQTVPRVTVPAGRYIVLIVRDTGLGMDDRALSHLFEPFFTTKEAGKGTGLGLATVYGIVTQSGGFISVDSAPGRGSTFQIYFPAGSTDAAIGAPQAEGDVPRGHETILVVEDDEPLRRFVARTLTDLGYTVLAAGDGPQALQLASSHMGPIHLLVSDVVLPKMGGREVAERVRASHASVKTLFVSGYAGEAIVERGQWGDAPLLPKPFTPGELARRVRARLDEPGAARG